NKAQTRALDLCGYWAVLILFWEHGGVSGASALPLPRICHLAGRLPLLRTTQEDNEDNESSRVAGDISLRDPVLWEVCGKQSAILLCAFHLAVETPTKASLKDQLMQTRGAAFQPGHLIARSSANKAASSCSPDSLHPPPPPPSPPI
ncbi:unnamed protein product, partial [Pleuronectes platessa]